MAIAIQVTQAGLNAEAATGLDGDLNITHIELGSGTAAPALGDTGVTSLSPRRVFQIDGEHVVATRVNNNLVITWIDNRNAVEYDGTDGGYEIGIFRNGVFTVDDPFPEASEITDSGELYARASDTSPLFTKAAGQHPVYDIGIQYTDASGAGQDFPDVTIVPQGTRTIRGGWLQSTDAELELADPPDIKVVSAAQLRDFVHNRLGTGSILPTDPDVGDLFVLTASVMVNGVTYALGLYECVVDGEWVQVRKDVASGTTLPPNPSLGNLFVLTEDVGGQLEGLYECVSAGAWAPVYRDFDLHEDVSTEVTDLAEDDRFVVTDESETGEPMRYITRENFRKNLIEPQQALTGASVIDWDAGDKPNALLTLNSDKTFSAPTNATTGHYYILTIVQDGTGGRSVTWHDDFRFSGIGDNLSLSQSASTRDVLAFQYTGTHMACIGVSYEV